MSETFLESMKEKGSFWAKSKITQFISDEELKKIPQTSKDELEKREIGIVAVDDDGNVLYFNDFEAKRSGVTAQFAEGKHFFTEVAPCTNNILFAGSFKKGVKEKEMHLLFPYTFTYKMKPTPVKVMLYRDKDTSSNWIVIKWP